MPKTNSSSKKHWKKPKEAVERVLSGDRKVNLSAQSSHIRRLQHALAARYNVGSASTGHEPNRHVIIASDDVELTYKPPYRKQIMTRRSVHQSTVYLV